MRIARTLVVWLLCTLVWPAHGVEVFDIGLATSGARIDAAEAAARGARQRTVLVVGGLSGDDASAAAVRRAVERFERRRDGSVRVLAIPLANPDGVELEFPPTGAAYRERSESHALWRFIGAQGPDLVLIAGEDRYGLAAALAEHAPAGVGHVPARVWTGPEELVRLGPLPQSGARLELERRRARSPQEVAEQLAAVYGREFNTPWYIGAIALIGRIRLGDVADVQRLVEPYVDGTRDSLARPNSLVLAGHIVFTELARRTGDARYEAAVRKVAELGFEDGRMKEAMPYHDEYSDSIFMGTAIVAQAGALTGERKYFDMADRHLKFMQNLDLRPDGLYRHQPATDAAWGRGNGFAAIGLAMTLAELPRDHPGFTHALESYRNHMAALLPYQNRDGLWRNVVDHPGAYPELSGTAMIGWAMLRGLHEGWIGGRDYEGAVERAWLAVSSRTSPTGEFIDVCESTARMTSLEQYLRREAILGRDPRAGAMVLLFATELMQKPRA